MRRGFTVIEIIFVVTIVAILIGIAAPRLLEKDDLSLAADQVIGHIRYTQHLALMDDRFDPNDNKWFKGWWQIRFHATETTDGKWSYSIYSDRPGYSGHPNWDELAVNPLERQRYMSPGFSTLSDSERLTPELCIGCAYGIELIAFDSSCSHYGSTRIAFDEMGRPYDGNPSNYTTPYQRDRALTQRCRITLTHENDEHACICIEPETGYAHRCSCD